LFYFLFLGAQEYLYDIHICLAPSSGRRPLVPFPPDPSFSNPEMKMKHLRGIATAATKPTFVPRQTFEISQDIPRSYFLGHHRETLEQMKKMIDEITYVIECRDFRVPASSSNPIFSEALGDKPRMIIYTKRDLGGSYKLEMQKVRMGKDTFGTRRVFSLCVPVHVELT
jgi:hypothetical protein